jgi:hypothetical protein
VFGDDGRCAGCKVPEREEQSKAEQSKASYKWCIVRYRKTKREDDEKDGRMS